MNILYTNFHTHCGGGHTTYLRYLLGIKNNTNYLACPKTSELYQIFEKTQDATVFDVSFPSKFLKNVVLMMKSIWKVAKIIREHNIDIVHTNQNADNRIVFYASLLVRKKFKVVFTVHNSKSIKKRITSQLRFNQFNSAVIYVCHSIVKTIGISNPQVPIHIIENGIDTTYWNLNPTLPGPVLTLVSIAGTGPCKGWQYLIWAIKHLPEEKRKRFIVKIVGTIPSSKDMDRYFGGDYCSDIVSFVGFRAEPKVELIGADVGFVLSDYGETISFACREMMSCSLPVIVSDIGGLPNNVDHGLNGWVTKRADVESIGLILLNILDKTPSELMAMKLAAREKALKSFDLALMLNKTQEVYASLA